MNYEYEKSEIRTKYVVLYQSISDLTEEQRHKIMATEFKDYMARWFIDINHILDFMSMISKNKELKHETYRTYFEEMLRMKLNERYVPFQDCVVKITEEKVSWFKKEYHAYVTIKLCGMNDVYRKI